jgi:hypothetical protein
VISVDPLQSRTWHWKPLLVLDMKVDKLGGRTPQEHELYSSLSKKKSWKDQYTSMPFGYSNHLRATWMNRSFLCSLALAFFYFPVRFRPPLERWNFRGIIQFFYRKQLSFMGKLHHSKGGVRGVWHFDFSFCSMHGNMASMSIVFQTLI